MEMPPLTTARLIVRPFRPDDLDNVLSVYGETGTSPADQAKRREWMLFSIDRAEHLERLEQPPYGDRAIELRVERRVIGATGLVPAFGPFGRLPSFGGQPDALNTAEFALYWHVHPAYRRQGFAAEAAQAIIDYAFTTLNIARIIAETADDNLASQGVMRHLGMRIERNPKADPHWFQVVGSLTNPRPVP